MWSPGIEQISAIVQPWADAYSDSKVLPIATTVLHVGGLLTGGGLAIASDRAVLLAKRTDPARQRQVLVEVRSIHALVISAIVVIAISGIGFLTADLKTYVASPVYWTKMVLVLLLLANGARIYRAEKRGNQLTATLPDDAPVPPKEWNALRTGAWTSLILWFVIMAFGVTLSTI